MKLPLSKGFQGKQMLKKILPNLIHQQLSHLTVFYTQVAHRHGWVAMVVPLTKDFKSGTMIYPLMVSPGLA
jgi:hypothetical protein